MSRSLGRLLNVHCNASSRHFDCLGCANCYCHGLEPTFENFCLLDEQAIRQGYPKGSQAA